jgi:hypothetical protein
MSKDINDLCEYYESNGGHEPPDECTDEFTHVLISHEYPKQRALRSCAFHIARIAQLEQWVTFHGR